MTEDIKKDNSEASELDNLKPDIEDLRRQADEYLNGWKRAQADLINYQKDEAKRLEEVSKFSNESLIREIISVIDNLNLAFASINKSGGNVDEGLVLIQNQLNDIIKRRGITKISAKPGEAYDPMHHEAIAMIEPTESLKSGMIAEEVEPGYMLHDYVLKPARVKVVS